MTKVLLTVRKFLVSGFVVFTFVAYALHERVVHSAGITNGSTPEQTAIALVVPTPTQVIPPTPVPVPTATDAVVPTVTQPAPTLVEAAPTTSDTPVPTATQPAPAMAEPTVAAPTAVASTRYKDGQYTGSVADAYYGPLQVKAVIQQGKIANVQFLDYPHDRRTSQRINSQAMPYLQEEAIQAQSANVDLISGATLTSQAFVESLQAALNGAKG